MIKIVSSDNVHVNEYERLVKYVDIHLRRVEEIKRIITAKFIKDPFHCEYKKGKITRI